ncbi:FAST kinase domain-containing protein 1-like [Crotalus adamanteus]|uniref:FAST kinase domain-containing protein 1-like n=1 Tax=Crotalus adamanteus TaxID=8729 RepID=A0AAW1CAF8_CROAD
MLWFEVDAHDSLVEELVVEGWKRLNELTPPLLSKFALCVQEQHLHHSPLMGEIAHLVDKKLDSIQDSRALSVVMNCISSVTSSNLKKRLIEKAEDLLETTDISVNDARRFIQFLRNVSFLHWPLLFIHLAPMVQQEMQKELSEKLLLIADDLGRYQTLIVAEKMQEVQYRNPLLIEKIVSLLHKYLDQYKPFELLRVTNVLAMLHWPKSDIYSKLQQLSICHLQVKRFPADILMLVHALSNLPSPYVDEAVVTQIDAIVPQCNLSQLNRFTIDLLKWMKHQKIAAVTTEHIDQIYYSEVHVILALFSLFNYEPPEAEKFFEACINHISLHLEHFEPSLLVLLGFALASAGYFPQKVIKAIFNIEFLSKLDAELQILPWKTASKSTFQLMELNRAVCLECPELQIPWFHKRFCEQLKKKKTDLSSPLQQQIYILLGEILGRSHYARCSVLTSYYYRIDFEFIVDKNRRPAPYIDQHVAMLNSDNIGGAEAGHSYGKQGLPPGLQRIAMEFLDSEAFCKNSNHVKGYVAMKKRHLEILGYQVVQIPHYEWNSMELSPTEAKIEYLANKIFEKL